MCLPKDFCMELFALLSSVPWIIQGAECLIQCKNCVYGKNGLFFYLSNINTLQEIIHMFSKELIAITYGKNHN